MVKAPQYRNILKFPFPSAIRSLCNPGKSGGVLFFLPFSHPKTRGTKLEGGRRVDIEDPDHVFTIMLELRVINLTYIGRRKEKLWPE